MPLRAPRRVGFADDEVRASAPGTVPVFGIFGFCPVAVLLLARLTASFVFSLYLMPDLVQLDQAVVAELTLPEHLRDMLPDVVAGDPTALRLFLAEGLKAEETGKQTSSAEMSTTGVWGERDPKEADAMRGADETRRMIAAAVNFIDRWNELAGSD